MKCEVCGKETPANYCSVECFQKHERNVLIATEIKRSTDDPLNP